MVQVLDDADVVALADMAELVEVCRQVTVTAAAGIAATPPRVRVGITPEEDEDVVFTVGGLPDAWGFRAYDTTSGGTDDQLVAVWDRASGSLQGLVVGAALGPLRTGALGGVAVDLLAPGDATSCAVVGAGVQARTQLHAAAAVRPLTDVRVTSRTPASRMRFAEEVGDELGLAITPVAQVEDALEDVDIVLMATNATAPVVPDNALVAGRHVSTVGPKQVGRHELPVAVADAADLVVSDAPAQVRATPNHVLAEHPVFNEVLCLGDMAASGWERPADAATLYLSTGLAGTEVAVARHLFQKARRGRTA